MIESEAAQSSGDSALTPPKGDESQSSWQSALAVATITSVLFLLGYGGTSYLTSLRSDVGTWYYEWEKWIPFVPIMIVPYMSIDLFFVAAPFFCSTRQELRVLGKRLSAVVIVASICFLIYPLELAVQRPEASGLFGQIYNWFTSLDRPYNLCPSMHIALRTVLAAHYGKHSRGLVRVIMNGWFFLIGCSTLLLYQHHFIDVVGGFVLAVAVMYVFDGLSWRSRSESETGTIAWKLAAMYALIAGMMVVPLFWSPPLGWLTLWPAISCALTALGYLGLGPSVYRRRHGMISWPARLVMGPVLAGQWLSWKYYARQSRTMDHVIDQVWIGRRLNEKEAVEATQRNVGAVVDVCVAMNEAPTLRNAITTGQEVARLELPILDLTAPTKDQLQEAIAFIEANRDHGVLVHCKAGYSRSAAIVAAWLVATGRCPTAESAFDMLRAVRPRIVIRPEIQNLSFDDLSTHHPRSLAESR